MDITITKVIQLTVNVEAKPDSQEEVNEFKQRRAIMLEVRDMVQAKYSLFYKKSFIGTFAIPNANNFTCAEGIVFSVLSLILNTDSTDAQPKTKMQALGMWWLASWLVGGHPSAQVGEEMQEKRNTASKASVGGLWGWTGAPVGNAKEEVEFMKVACSFARGLVSSPQINEEIFPILCGFIEELGKIQRALEQEFDFEAKPESSTKRTTSKYL